MTAATAMPAPARPLPGGGETYLPRDVVSLDFLLWAHPYEVAVAPVKRPRGEA